MPFWKTSAKGGSASGGKKTEDTKLRRPEESESRPQASGDAKEVITQVVKQRRGAEEKMVETKQVITFEIDKEEYAAPILDLREILRIPEIIAVPGTPPFVKGIFNLRGQIVVVIDLEKRFALKREHPMAPRDIIIVEVGGTIFGVVVDEVTGVLRAPVPSIKPTPPLVASKIHADYLNGVIVLEDLPAGQAGVPGTGTDTEKKRARTLLLLDLPKMLSEEEFLGFGNSIRQTVEEVK